MYCPSLKSSLILLYKLSFDEFPVSFLNFSLKWSSNLFLTRDITFSFSIKCNCVKSGYMPINRGWLICVGCVGRSGLRGSEWVGVGCVGRSGLSGSKVKPHFHASLIFSDPLRPTQTHSDPLNPLRPTPTHSNPLNPLGLVNPFTKVLI